MDIDAAERMKFVDDMADQLELLIKQQFPRGGNLEFAILKAHLIVEYAITQYIRSSSATLVEEKSLERFTFSEKIEISYLMGLGISDATLLPSIERLNKIRNQVAHQFTLDRALVDELLKINSHDYDGFSVTNDRDRVSALRRLCLMIAGNIAGLMTVRAMLSFDK